MDTDNSILWVDKYNPTSIDDLVLDQAQKDYFKNIVISKNMANIILAGAPGIGKCLDYEEEIDIYVNKHTYDILSK